MRISIAQAHKLAVDVLTRYDVCQEHAEIVADHLIDATAAGHPFAGLPRVMALVSNLKEREPARPIKVERRSANSAIIDGGGTNGYVTSLVGIDTAIELARENGVGIVGISDTWFSGRLAYYVERAARAGMVAFHTANTLARVAPSGGVDRIFGTNPLAFAFPCDPDPLVIDFGTGMTTWGDVLLREKLGKPLEPGCAVDPQGNPTTDPTKALEGAFIPWGGHRGYGLSLVVQLLGVMCGSRIVVDEVSACGFFFFVMDPALLTSPAAFKADVTALAAHIEQSRPAPGVGEVRVPGRKSSRLRREALASGMIDVDEEILSTLESLRDA